MTTARLDALRSGSRSLSDMEGGDEFIDNTELTGYVNEGIAALLDVELDADDARLFAINGPRLVSAGTYSWTLPANFRRLVSLSIQSGSYYYPALRADSAEYAELAANPPEKQNARYFLRKEFGTGVAELYIFPSSLTATDIAYTYIANPTELSLDSDTFVGTTDEIEYIKTYVAVKMLAKEESDTAVMYSRQEQLATRIRNAVKDVDVGAPKVVRNMRKRYGGGLY